MLNEEVKKESNEDQVKQIALDSLNHLPEDEKLKVLRYIEDLVKFEIVKDDQTSAT